MAQQNRLFTSSLMTQARPEPLSQIYVRSHSARKKTCNALPSLRPSSPKLCCPKPKYTAALVTRAPTHRSTLITRAPTVVHQGSDRRSTLRRPHAAAPSPTWSSRCSTLPSTPIPGQFL